MKNFFSAISMDMRKQFKAFEKFMEDKSSPR